MKFKGNGIVWDAENNCVLCKFENGELETKDKRVQNILKHKNYKVKDVQL